MSMCRVISCVVGRGCLLPVSSVGKTLVSFDLLHFLLQGQTCLLLQVSLDFLLLLSSPLWWKGHYFLVLVVEGLVGIILEVKKICRIIWQGPYLKKCTIVLRGLKLRSRPSVSAGIGSRTPLEHQNSQMPKFLMWNSIVPSVLWKYL